MIFQDELLDKVLGREKTVTRRICSDNPNSPWWIVKCAVKPHSTKAAQRGRSKPREANINIVSVERQTLGQLIHADLITADREAKLEGFDSLAHMAEEWRRINGAQSWDADLKVWRIEFSLLELVAAA